MHKETIPEMLISPEYLQTPLPFKKSSHCFLQTVHPISFFWVQPHLLPSPLTHLVFRPPPTSLHRFPAPTQIIIPLSRSSHPLYQLLLQTKCLICTVSMRGGKKRKSLWSIGGSTNMPLFGRVHECEEHEHLSEKKVWEVSEMKWTLPNKKKDP